MDDCKSRLREGCKDCNNVDMFGDTCHAYQAYNQAKEEMFNIFSEHCRNGHFIIGFDNQGIFRGCIPREAGKFDREQWMCSYENCPLMKSNNKNKK